MVKNGKQSVTRNELRDELKKLESRLVRGVDQKIALRFSEQDKRIDSKFLAQDKRIDAKFSEQDRKIDVKFSEQDRKIDAKFSDQDKKIDAKLNGLEQKIDDKFRMQNETLGLRIAFEVEQKVKAAEDRLHRHFDQAITKLDPLIGEIRTARQERVFLNARLTDHEERIVHLESIAVVDNKNLIDTK